MVKFRAQGQQSSETTDTGQPRDELADSQVPELFAKVRKLEGEIMKQAAHARPPLQEQAVQILETILAKEMQTSISNHAILLESLYKLGVFYVALGDPKRAHQRLLLALKPELRPSGMTDHAWNKGCASVHDKIARIFKNNILEFNMASKHWETCLRLDPANVEGVLGYSMHLIGHGLVTDALPIFDEYEKHLKDGQYHAPVWSNKMLALNYLCGGKLTAEQVFAEHLRWGALVKKLFAEHAITEHTNSKDQHRRLKVGYLSPDLCTHTVALYSEVLLRYRDKDKYHVTVYFCRESEDEDAGRLMQYVDKWVNLFSKTAGEAAKLIQDDQIDILVELTGHTANNRLDILACRPAPIQVTWIGYPNTTGLDYVHYRVTDGITDPVDTTQPFAEKLIRLPDNFLCFIPHPATPSVNPSPFETNGWVTFGSFNSLGKVQQECFELWARVLQSVPDSRICLKSNIAFSMPHICETWYKRFEAKGICRERVLLVGFMPGQDGHLSAYHKVDIALDSFPYGGTTTISEAMLMGVPVITLRAPRDKLLHAWNVGLGMNTTIGLTDLVADTEEDYVQIAQKLAQDKERLAGFRASLREDFLKSPLGDAPRYQRNVEAMYQTMWAQYCSGDWPPNRA